MSRRRQDRGLSGDPLWYKDAIIYELHVRAFCDSNGDGIGDFNGLISKLDYLRDLGVTALWVLPFYPSPLRDDGYDIADYMKVNPAYGTLADFKRFLKEAHGRNLRVITELVINHTSTDHPWFQRAREAPPGSRHREFYVWSDTADRYQDARIIFQDFEQSNWTWDPVAKAYYWHRFYSHQPDLNFDHPDVQETLFKVLDFWMGMGVDGMRLDAVPYLFEREGTNCENLPETHAFLRKLRAYIDAKYEGRMLLAEANQWPEDAAAYFGDGHECHMNFHFPLMPRMFMALHLEDRFPVSDILTQTPEIPATCQWATFLRNHDELTLEMVTDEDRDYMWRVYAEDKQARINLGIRRRLAPLLRTRRKIELLNLLLFSLPGTPVLYYGDEIGMGDNIYVGDRDGVRTPMQWSPDRNAGFSRANPQKLYLPVTIDPEYHYEALNVETELGNPSSLLWWMKRVITLARRHKAFGRGDLKLLHPRNDKVLAFVRTFEEERILVVANLSRYCQHVQLDLRDYKGFVPEELFGKTSFPAIKEQPYFLSLSPHACFWFELLQPATAASASIHIPELRDVSKISDLLAESRRAEIEATLGSFVVRQRWFRSKARRVRRARIVDAISTTTTSVMLLLEIDFYEGAKETYSVPLALCEGRKARQLLDKGAVVAKVAVEDPHDSRASAVVCDAVQSEDFTTGLLSAIAGRRTFRGYVGRLVTRSRTRVTDPKKNGPMPARVGAAEQTNTSIIYGEHYILKLLRAVEAGVNADTEILQFLNERTNFKHAPELVATIEYERTDRESALVGALQKFVENRGDAWRFTLEGLDRYFEHVSAEPTSATLEPLTGPLVARAAQTPPPALDEAVGHYMPMVHLLGQRTAELHAALASDRRDPAFSPQPFSEHHQRSLYQSARARLLDTLDTLEEKLHALPEADQESARNLLLRRNDIDQKLKGVTKRKIEATRIRCHGDFHLGQVLYTGKDFVIIDFEGEPARSVSERRFKRSPLRDVAGMLRSFHYAAASALKSRYGAQAEITALESWSHGWADWVGARYLSAYLETAHGMAAAVKDKRDVEELLQFYSLEKCIYELGYELNNRPDWAAIPLSGMHDLLETGEADE